MDLDNTILQQRMPYSKLEKLGINREAADSLPNEFKKSLCSGETTPLIKVTVSTANGKVVSIPLKMQLTGDLDNNPSLKIYPVRADLSQDTTQKLKLTDSEAEQLKKGMILIKAIEKDGRKQMKFLQMDPETKSVIAKNLNEVKIDKALQNIEQIEDIQLGIQQKQQAREGNPIELKVGDQKVTVGVDLREPNGFRVMQGDMDEWNRQAKMRYDNVHPEYLGLVKTEKNRWEYQQVVNKQSIQRAIKLDGNQEQRSQGMKL